MIYRVVIKSSHGPSVFRANAHNPSDLETSAMN